MKAAALTALAILSFCLTLVGAMAVTGNLSKEALDRILNPQPAQPAQMASRPDDLDPVLKALKKREESIKQKEKELAEREQRLKLRERDLEETREQIEESYTQFTESLNQADATYENRLTEAAKTLEGMKPQNAAQVLSEWSPRDAAAILKKVAERQRGKILDEIDPEQAAVVLQALQQRPY